MQQDHHDAGPLPDDGFDEPLLGDGIGEPLLGDGIGEPLLGGIGEPLLGGIGEPHQGLVNLSSLKFQIPLQIPFLKK